MIYKTILVMLLTWILVTYAQDDQKKAEKKKEGWEKELVGNLNFNQSQFDNWQRGGENSWNWQFDFNAQFDYHKEKFGWLNKGRLAFGQSKTGSNEAKKSADEIKLESVLVYKVTLHINPYISVTGQTQLVEGYAYTDTSKIRISNFMDPGYFTQAIGLGIKPWKFFTTRLGASIKETFTSTDEARIRFAADESPRIEYGAESISDLKYQLNKIIHYSGRLELFSNLKAFNEIDVNWDNIFTAKVAEYLNVTFNFNLFYDRDIDIKRQLKQTLAVGLTYTFIK